MCKYCNEEPKQLNNDIDISNEIKLNYYGKCVLLLRVDEYDNYYEREIEINYCPMCGRKLSD